LDQMAAKTIWKKKITTYIVGTIGAIDKILKKQKFIGTVVKG